MPSTRTLATLLLAFFFLFDAYIKSIDVTYIDFMKFKYERYYLANSSNWHGKVHVYIWLEIACTYIGSSMLLCVPFPRVQRYGALLLMAVFAPVSIVAHPFYAKYKFRKNPFIQFSKHVAIFAGLLLLYRDLTPSTDGADSEKNPVDDPGRKGTPGHPKFASATDGGDYELRRRIRAGGAWSQK